MAKSTAAIRQAYLYTGPVTQLPLDGERVLSLFPGASYRDLPLDHPPIANLIERRLLTPETAEASEPATPTETATEADAA